MYKRQYQTLADSLKLVETVERVQAVELLESEVSLSEEDREALLGAITQRPVSKVLNLSPTAVSYTHLHRRVPLPLCGARHHRGRK